MRPEPKYDSPAETESKIRTGKHQQKCFNYSQLWRYSALLSEPPSLVARILADHFLWE